MDKKYRWIKKGSIKVGDEVIVPQIGQNVTALVRELSENVVKQLLKDRRIEDDTARRQKNAELMKEQQEKIDKALAKKKSKKKGE
jgi:hypothetical protein